MNKAELEKRKAEMAAAARTEIAKSGFIQFRLEPANILKLYKEAAKSKKPVGTMVREWVLEHLNQPMQLPVNERLSRLEQQVNILTKRRQRA